MTIIVSELLRSTRMVICGVSTRHGGVSPAPFGMNLSFSVGDTEENVRRNRELFLGTLGIRGDQTAMPMQFHSNVVKQAHSPGSYPGCDGLISDTPGVCLCISIADCVPLLIVETQRGVIAAIHAGWRGTSGRIAERGVKMMIEEFRCRPEHMIAYVGPSAGACCYSVGEDVAGQFSGEFVRETGGRMFLDLKKAIAAQLVEAGMVRASIEVSTYCTIGDSHLFHSYRRDKEQSGRMMGVIGLGEPSVR